MQLNPNKNLSGHGFQRPYLSLKEAASFLDISQSLMYKLSASNAITKYKRGGKVYYKESDLISYIEEGKIEGLDQVEKSVDEMLIGLSNKGGKR